MAETTYIEGRSPEKARELLKAARDAGLPPGAVRTTSTGYIVPAEIADSSDSKSMETAEAQEREAKAQAEVSETARTAEDQDGGDGDKEMGEGDNPSDFSVKEVQAYLENASDEERERVLQAERDGQARKTLVGDKEDN